MSAVGLSTATSSHRRLWPCHRIGGILSLFEQGLSTSQSPVIWLAMDSRNVSNQHLIHIIHEKDKSASELRQVFNIEIQKVGVEGARVLRFLGDKVEKMEKLSSEDLLETVHEGC